MQSRHTLPGWYGLGTALSAAMGESSANLEILKRMYSGWPFFHALIDNAQMILAKADMNIARLYADLVLNPEISSRIFGAIESEYRRTVEGICAITGQSALLEKMPILKGSIGRRNPYVDPLSLIQLVLLRRIRSEATDQTGLLDAVLESINGIASGLKNTG
jgi:phosphoenolpyruvate carboxylase